MAEEALTWTAEKPPAFFISRSGKDAAIAIAVADALIEAGHTVLIQDKDFANQNFMDMMDRGLASGAKVIAILSEDYLQSDHCRAEWQHPLADDPLNRHTRLILLRARECMPRGLLKAIAYWDLVKVRSTRELLKAVVLAAIDPAHRKSPQLADCWRKPELIRHTQIRETPGFTGRGEELAAIDAALWARETPALTQSAAVQGFGGVGKSTIAREYAWRVSQYDGVYSGVWWLDAEQQGPNFWPGIEQGYIELGDIFIRGLAQQQDRPAAARTARDFLEKGGFDKPWLIVYDNVDDVRTLAQWLPPKGAHVIVTSRLENKARGTTAVEIGTWPLPDAIRYLQENSGRTDLSEAEAQAIAEELGCLPLALAHAAAYLSDNANATAESYLKSITSHMRKVPEAALAIAPRAVFATLQHNIAQAEKRAKGAAAVMSLAAFFAPDAIPEELFRQEAEHYPTDFAGLASDGPELEEAIGALGRLRVVTIDRDCKSFTVHRLVQAAAKDALGPEAVFWSAAAVKAANSAFPYDDYSNWHICERLLPHARAAIKEASNDIGETLAHLCGKAAGYMYERAEYDLAEPLFKRTLSIFETALGPEHPDVGTSLNNLAGLYDSQGKYGLAEPLYKRSLAIREKALGSDHPSVGTSLNNLAELYKGQGRYDLAEPLYKRSLDIREKTLGPDHPSVGTSLNNLAELYRDKGQTALAEPLYKRTLSIFETALVPDHPWVGTSLNNLGELYRGQGQFDLAEPLLKRSLAVREKALGPDHPSVGTALNNLASLYRAQGKFDLGELLLKRTLSIFETALGPDHPNVGTSLNNLAGLYRAHGKYDLAEPLYQRTISIFEKALGPDHPSVGTAVNNLAALSRAQGKFDLAEPLYKRSLAISEKALGPNHPSLGTSLNNLAGLCESQGKYDLAEPLYKRSLNIRETALGPDHPDVGNFLNNLAGLYLAQGKYHLAEPLYKRSLVIREKALGPDHPDFGITLNSLAVLYYGMQKLDEAVHYIRRGSDVLLKALGPDHPDTKNAIQVREVIEAALKAKRQ